MIYHQDITPERWFKFSLVMQLANVGADVDRTSRWKKRRDLEDRKIAFARALELLNLTIADPKNKKILLQDLIKMREALIDFFEGPNQYSTTDEGWYNYFMWFGYMAAYERERIRKKFIG